MTFAPGLPAFVPARRRGTASGRGHFRRICLSASSDFFFKFPAKIFSAKKFPAKKFPAKKFPAKKFPAKKNIFFN